MTGRRKIAVAACVLAALGARAAAADPAPAPDLTHFVHLESGSHVTTDGGTKTDLPPGYFFDEPTFKQLDADVKALQDGNTSKDAQIKVYKAEIEKWQPGWMTLAGALVGGVVLGYYARGKL